MYCGCGYLGASGKVSQQLTSEQVYHDLELSFDHLSSHELACERSFNNILYYHVMYYMILYDYIILLYIAY